MSDEHTEVSRATRQAEAEEAKAPHDADRPPSPEEEDAVDDREVNSEVAEHYRQMTALGAADVGEGRIP